MTPIVKKIHHVAYRCKDALETARWYEKHLGMKLVLSIAEDAVPSTGEPDPYMHIFMDAGMGNVLAFFELPTQPDMGRVPNTPVWTQHLALEVGSMDELLAAKKRLQVYSDQTRPLVDYYSHWAQAEPAAAPKYRAIQGTGSVEEITERALSALSS